MTSILTAAVSLTTSITCFGSEKRDVCRNERLWVGPEAHAALATLLLDMLEPPPGIDAPPPFGGDERIAESLWARAEQLLLARMRRHLVGCGLDWKALKEVRVDSCLYQCGAKLEQLSLIHI